MYFNYKSELLSDMKTNNIILCYKVSALEIFKITFINS